MSRFIPIDKMKQLRDSARNGDDRARKILSMQMNGDDFGADLDEYFKPVPQQVEEAPTGATSDKPKDDRLAQFLASNNVKEGDADYDEYVNDFYAEVGEEKPNEEEPHEGCECKEQIKKLMKEELDAIDSYNKAITHVMGCEFLTENQKRKILSRLEEIKADEVEHHRELTSLLSLCDKKEENEEGIVE